MQVLVGVDGGGTGCRVAVGTPGNILAVAQGGPANVTSDPERAVKHVLEAAEAAAVRADIDLSMTVAHVGLAGVMDDADAAWVAARMPFARVAVSDDRPTTVVGALGDTDGFVAAIGTGSFIASRRDDAFDYVGGWGLIVSDQGSGAWMGRAVLEQALKCYDGIEAYSQLTIDVMAQFGNDPNAIVSFAAKATPNEFATLAPMVFDATDAGDEFGSKLVAMGAAYIQQGLDGLGFSERASVCLTGGAGPRYASFFKNVPAQGAALDGALILAQKLEV